MKEKILDAVRRLRKAQRLQDEAVKAYENFRRLSNEVYALGAEHWQELQERIYGDDRT